MYEIRLAPGWHGKPQDPVVETTEDEREAAMMAGEVVGLKMPGESNLYRYYAIDGETGEHVTPIKSFRCDVCHHLHEWGEDGPIGGMGGKILECPGGAPKHLVTWMCEDCAASYEEDPDEPPRGARKGKLMQTDEELIAGFVADSVQRMDEETFALFAQIMEEIHNSWDPALDAARKPQTVSAEMKRMLYEILVP